MGQLSGVAGMTPLPAPKLIVQTGLPAAPGCVIWNDDEKLLVHGSLPATNLLTQTVGWPVTLLGLTSSAVAAASAALNSSCGSVLKMAAVRPPARDDWET